MSKTSRITVLAALLATPLFAGAMIKAETTKNAGEGETKTAVAHIATTTIPADLEKRMEERDAMNSATDTFTSETKARLRSAFARFSERRQDAFDLLFDRAVLRIDAMIDRFTHLSDRMSSRMKKLEVMGVDVSKPRADLLLFRTNMNAAKKALDEAKTLSTDASSTDALLASRDALKSAKRSLLDAHDALEKTADDLESSASPYQLNTVDVATSTATPNR